MHAIRKFILQIAILACPPFIAGAPAIASDVKFFARASNSNASPVFSEAVRVDNMLYLSGSIGTNALGKLPSDGIKAEAKQTMDNIGAMLAKSHSSFDDVVQCTVVLADIKELPDFNEVYRSYFSKHFPTRMVFAANGLALNARVEVQCNAVIKNKVN